MVLLVQVSQDFQHNTAANRHMANYLNRDIHIKDYGENKEAAQL